MRFTAGSTGRNALVNFASRALVAALNVAQLILVARLFGASVATDAYMVATWTPTLFWTLAETVLIASFVPYVVSIAVRDGREAARRAANGIFTWAVLALAAVSLAVFLAAPLVSYAAAPGFDARARSLTTAMMRLLAPAILLSGATSFFASIFYAARRFVAPAVAAPLPALTVALWLLLARQHGGIQAVAVAFTAGVALQLVVLAAALSRAGLLPRFRRTRLSEHRELWQLMGPRIGANAANQGMAGVDRVFASLLGLGSVSILNYAYRLARLAPKLISASLGKTLIPSLAGSVARGETREIREFVPRYIGFVLFILAPIAVACIYYRLPLIRLLYERGRFSGEDTLLTANVFLFYMLAVLLQTVRLALGGVYAATRDTVTPFRISLLSFALNIPLAWLGSLAWGVSGIAVATLSVSAFAAAAMVYKLNAKIGPIRFSPAVRSLARVLPAAAVMGSAIWLTDRIARGVLGDAGLGRHVLAMFVSGAVAGLLYVLVCLALRLRSVLALPAAEPARSDGADARLLDGGMDDGY